MVLHVPVGQLLTGCHVSFRWAWLQPGPHHADLMVAAERVSPLSTEIMSIRFRQAASSRCPAGSKLLPLPHDGGHWAHWELQHSSNFTDS